MKKPTQISKGRSPKSGRLLRFTGEAIFRNHRRSAQRFEEPAFTAFVATPKDNAWRFAAVASKARIGGAVERNRAKRRLRAAFVAAQKTGKQPLAVILYAKEPSLWAEMEKLVESLAKIFCEVAVD